MTQKNKNISLITGLVFVFILAYVYGFSKTIAVGNQLEQLQKQELLYKSAPSQLKALTVKEANLNKVLEANNLSGTSLQNNLLEMLNTSSANLNFKITGFENPHLVKEPATGSNITTYNFTLSGDYNSLIQIIHQLEQKSSFGNIVHVNFNKKKNYRTGKYNLLCSILLQRIH